MVSLVSQHSLEGEHRLWVAQATFDWVGWQHVRALAYLLLACCVRTGEGARSSTMPLSCTGAVASSRRVATQPRISQAWVHTPPVGGAGHFRLGRLALLAHAQVSVARLLCADGVVITLEHHAPPMHRRSRVQPSCRNEARREWPVCNPAREPQPAAESPR